jgi:hypothetical protein
MFFDVIALLLEPDERFAVGMRGARLREIAKDVSSDAVAIDVSGSVVLYLFCACWARDFIGR